MGWPNPRSVASENAATSSASRSSPPVSLAMGLHRTRSDARSIINHLSGEHPTTRGERIRIVVTVVDTTDAVDDVTGSQPARWSIAGMFLEGLTTRDYTRLRATLDPAVRFRALLPGGLSEWHGRTDVTEVFRSWFGNAEHFEIVEATVGEVAGRLQMTWRIRVRPAPFDIGPGWHLIEQHAFADVSERIDALDLVCSGFRPEPTSAHQPSRRDRR